MLATQHGLGYDTKTTTYNLKNMFLMTRRTASYVWYVRDYGNAYYDSPTYSCVGRPSIHLSSGVKILSGTGLPNDPYVVGI